MAVAKSHGRLSHRVICTYAARLGALAGVVLLLVRIAAAQAPGDNELRRYGLQHIPAAEAEQALARQLPAGTQIVVDPKLNQILVRGPAQVHQFVQSSLQSLDLPRQANPIAPPPRPASPTVLQMYPARSVDAVAAADWLRSQFPANAGVRVAGDSRTGQILVYAPAELQPTVAAKIAQMPQALPPRQTPPPAAAPLRAPPTAASAQTVQLRRQSAEQMEATLAKAMGNRMTPLAPGQPGSYQVRMAAAGSVQLDVDRAANRITVQGTGNAGPSCARLIEMLDQSPGESGQAMQLISLQTSRPADIRRAVDAIHAANASAPRPPKSAAAPPGLPGAKLALMFQQQAPDGAKPEEQTQPQAAPPAQAAPAGQLAQAAGLVGPVQIEVLEGLDVIVVRGSPRDVEQVMQIIEQIERLSAQTEPSIELYQMRYTDGEAVGILVSALYQDVFAPRQGAVTITPLVKPNALVLVGRPENVRTALDLIKRLDQPVPPETQFEVFRLKYASATTAQATVVEFFASRPGLGAKARVTSDFRTNSLIVQASRRDIAEVAALIERLDTQTSDAVNEIRVFPLEHSLAADVATILQNAVSVPSGGQAAGAAGARQSVDKSVMLRFVTVDAKGQKVLNSGILTGVQVTPDPRSNSLLVAAPADCMELIAALVHEVDQRPAATAQIKVFTIINGDVLSLVDMLQALFGQAGGIQQGLVQTGAREEESTLIPLRFAVDVRTNSIIASGSEGDLMVVEAILLRLDENDLRQRKSTVYRLKNAPAADVANAINQFLSSERQVETITPGLLSPFEQIEREVVVVPEPVSNSLIVSATPRFYDEIQAIVEQLDKRPPMVMIQVLIGQVQLDNFNEFGIELGLQDAILFDRSVLGAIQTLSTTSTEAGKPQVTTQEIVSATTTPGFNFNNQPLGNNAQMGGTDKVGGQSLSSFNLGRTNSQLGYGGLVLSASGESVNVMIRALQQCHRLDVLSRPQIMTLDNQPAFVQVGQRVPYITSSSLTTAGNQINTIQLQNVGLILGVTPRISPDGLVVMEIDAEKSEVGPVADGIPIAVINGAPVNAPKIETTTAQTTVSAMSGQTVVLGGLITKKKDKVGRRVPWLSDIPVLGHLFRYDSTQEQRTELLIIMTPHIVKTDEDVDRVRRIEAARISWCLADVQAIHGDIGVRGRYDQWHDSETAVVYPDVDPGTPPMPPPPGAPPAPGGAEVVPTPLPGTGPRVDEKVPSLVPPPSASGPSVRDQMRRAASPEARYFPPPGFDSTVMPAAYRQPQQ